MANQIFKYLNFDKSIVMKILHWNYGKINFWKDQIPSSCSWFFRGLYNSAIYLWPLCRINLVNPLDTSFLMDLWCFDIPIALKPTFININIDFDHFNISNLIQENSWNSTNLYHLLGNNFENTSPIINLIDNSSHNHWVLQSTKIFTTVYHLLNHHITSTDHWIEWCKLWTIKTIFFGLFLKTNSLHLIFFFIGSI